jgi:hypothetical protein
MSYGERALRNQHRAERHQTIAVPRLELEQRRT